MKYAAINLGPIIKTFSMARKPREFWAASYLFSYLMQCILKTLDKEKDKLELLSPFYTPDQPQTKVGLYPDRAFYQIRKEVSLDALLEKAVITFACKANLDIRAAQSFFHIMWISQEYDSTSEAIADLNQQLNILEQNQTAWEPTDYDNLLTYIQQVNRSSQQTNTALPVFPIKTLDDIARCEATEICHSFQRYVCIVQADGDHMGKIVTSKQLDQNNQHSLNSFSKRLIEFGKKACQRIKDFKGLPIYAGGDDLLFIAPVCNQQGKTIFDLLEEIDQAYNEIQEIADNLQIEGDNGNLIHTSLSYGISISYYKYPLYEAWKTAREQLFDMAKEKAGRNSIALKLRKNSGSDFQIILPKESEMLQLFRTLVDCSPRESLVSAVAHKFYSNEAVLRTLSETDSQKTQADRLEAFYAKTIDTDAKSESEQAYLTLTRKLYEQICQFKSNKPDTADQPEDSRTLTGRTISTFYGMLRLAKFIKGEEVKNE